jgi:hypothetical protein
MMPVRGVEGAAFFCAMDHVAMARALRRELERTETHHFRFIETADGPRQYCAKSTNFNLTAVDMSGHADPQAAAIAWMRDFMDKPFDLDKTPTGRPAPPASPLRWQQHDLARVPFLQELPLGCDDLA